MAYLDSNEPYSRVSDPLGNGLLIGGAMGGALAGGAHLFGKASNEFMKQTRKEYRNALRNGENRDTLRKQYTDAFSTKQGKAVAGLANGYKKSFGRGGLGTALSYGAGVLGMGLVGMGIDAMNQKG